jgi:hypothetical protein
MLTVEINSEMFLRAMGGFFRSFGAESAPAPMSNDNLTSESIQQEKSMKLYLTFQRRNLLIDLALQTFFQVGDPWIHLLYTPSESANRLAAYSPLYT